MKKCVTCDVRKEETSFDVKPDGHRMKVCIPCRHKSKEWRMSHRTHIANHNRNFIRKRRFENRQRLLELLKTKTCVDCGNKDFRVLEFDHKNREIKKDSISNLVRNNNWNTVLKEISKCDVRCSNCHRIRTGNQFGWYALWAKPWRSTNFNQSVAQPG